MRPLTILTQASAIMALSVPAFAQTSAPLADANGTSFVDHFTSISKDRWYLSDGWNNGPHQNCTWSKDQVSIVDGHLQLRFDKKTLGARNYICGEIQTKARFGYGAYEISMKSADGSGLNSAFFTYIGPTDKQPHDEIDFEVLGKNLQEVQVNQYIAGKGGNEKLAPVAGGANAGFNQYAFLWQKDRLRYYINGTLVQDVTDPAKLPNHAQKIFMSLWGSDVLATWMGPFSFTTTQTMTVDYVAFTAEGDKCQFPQSIVCAQQ